MPQLNADPGQAPAAQPLRAHGPRRVLRALAAALAITGALALLTVLARLAAGDELKPALRAASALEARKVLGPSGLDSWGAMLSAAHRQRTGGPLYAASMALDNCKYQYPPAALLLMEVLPHPEGPHLCSRDAEAGEEPVQTAWPAKRWIDLASQLSLLVTLALGVVLLRQALAAGRPVPPAGHAHEAAPPWTTAALVGVLGLTFFPLTWGHTLGQIQVQLNLAMTAALCAMLAGRSALAGALLGACCLFKPTYALFAVWALLRREWRLAGALLGVAAVGHGIALLRYGLPVHIEYLDFLRGLGRVGESYWANQSLTGLLHRWLEPGSGLQWADSAFGSSARAQAALPAFDWAAAGFPEEHAGVYVATVAGSLLLLGASFWPLHGTNGGKNGDANGGANGRTSEAHLVRTLDLGVAVAAITMASPIVWLHHYGSFFALFVLALAAAMRQAMSRTTLTLIGVSYALLGSVMLRPEAVFADRFTALLGSHGWLGGLLLMGLLMRQLRRC